ncbi:hypothetical protein MMC14_008153, partial [Varicellaria rhodocarpa]|nr:hypothetical protein [Varicellaria rhodocarpa]
MVFDLWKVVICTQTIQSGIILSACTLFIKKFLETLETKFVRGNDLRRRGLSGTNGYGFNNDGARNHISSKASGNL